MLHAFGKRVDFLSEPIQPLAGLHTLFGELLHRGFRSIHAIVHQHLRRQQVALAIGKLV